MYLRYFLIFALIVVSIALPAYAGTIINPGFESGTLGPWYGDRFFGSVTPPSVTTAYAHSGLYSATWVGNYELRQNFSPVATDLITEISFWALQPELNNLGLQVWFFYSDNTYTTFGPTVGNPHNWLKADVTSYLEPGKMLTGFSVWGYEGAGPAEDRTYFDDVTLRVPEPSLALLLGIGIVGVLALGRRYGRG
jgi:hypothetical protein